MCPAFDRLSFTEEVKDITLRYLKKKKKSFQFLKDKVGGKFCQSTRGSWNTTGSTFLIMKRSLIDVFYGHEL